MYECLYGYTPFACEDRQNTKLKILHHKKTLRFPQCDDKHRPSTEALDLMMHLLVDSEWRLSSKQYELNDFTKRHISGKDYMFDVDKHSKTYNGHFVYPNDADQIKAHPWFNTIDFSAMLYKRPPFVPRVKDWQDTKYFDEDLPISDIDSASSEIEEDEQNQSNTPDQAVVHSGADPAVSHHQHEDQHIIPSNAMKLNAVAENHAANAGDSVQNPLSSPLQHMNDKVVQWKEQQLEDDSQHTATENEAPKQKKKKEQKRPRDKILRDPTWGKTALQMRKNGAFSGYTYRKPKAIDDLIGEALEDETIGGLTATYGKNLVDAEHEKRVYLEAGGKMVV